MASEFGYAGKILRVDLSSGTITHVPTMDYADRFLGGRGVAAKIYWDEVSPEVKALDAENRLIFITGPLAGRILVPEDLLASPAFLVQGKRTSSSNAPGFCLLSARAQLHPCY
ncbi:hypothetical protein ES703_91637 [subsurface metagenome]